MVNPPIVRGLVGLALSAGQTYSVSGTKSCGRPTRSTPYGSLLLASCRLNIGVAVPICTPFRTTSVHCVGWYLLPVRVNPVVLDEAGLLGAALVESATRSAAE